jgi:Ni,Fe-hydrogenase I cytochrome b subunit
MAADHREVSKTICEIVLVFLADVLSVYMQPARNCVWQLGIVKTIRWYVLLVRMECQNKI